MALIAAGYADFPLIANHFGQRSLMPEPWIPVLYAMAMSVDALAALLFGQWFDKKRLAILAPAAFLSAFFAPLVFWGSFYAAMAGMVLWGIGMGGQESVMRAAAGGLVSPEPRGTAYGLLNSGCGLARLLGSMAMAYCTALHCLRWLLFQWQRSWLPSPLFIWIGKQTYACRWCNPATVRRVEPENGQVKDLIKALNA